MIELLVLVFGIILLIVFITYNYSKKNHLNIEKFENYYLSSCPGDYKSFYDLNGDMICCDGDIMSNKCLGDRQCILNGKGTPNMPNCVNMILEDYAEKAKSQCPASMMSYFEDNIKNRKGCTNGELNKTLNSPRDYNQPTCIIYSGYEENIKSVNSCYNQRILDSTPCFGNNCKKDIIQPFADSPILIRIGFNDSMGMRHEAYTRQSLENYLNVVSPAWKEQGMDLSKNINVAEVAKAYYIDRTMDKSEVQI